MDNAELNDVLRGETSTTTEEVQETPQTTEEVVVETTTDVQETLDPSVQGETTTEETPAQGEEQSTEVPVDVDTSLDEYGVPWKNRAMEQERKNQQLLENIPTVIEETLQKQNTKKEETPEYSIGELEAFIRDCDDPSQITWAENEKETLRANEFNKRLDTIRAEEQSKLKFTNTKQQAEHAVMTDPRFASAFVTDQAGNKQWNTTSPLAQGINRVMNSDFLKGKPDALLHAAIYTRGELLDKSIPVASQKLTSMKRENAKLKQQTLTEGGGNPQPTATTTAFQTAKAKAAKSGSKKDTQAAILEYFKRK